MSLFVHISLREYRIDTERIEESIPELFTYPRLNNTKVDYSISTRTAHYNSFYYLNLLFIRQEFLLILKFQNYKTIKVKTLTIQPKIVITPDTEIVYK